MEDNVPCMKTTFCQPEGSRKKGRPRGRWRDSVLKDLKTLEVWKKTRDGELERGWRDGERGQDTSGCSTKEEEETYL
jgi:hypothetical protein